MALDRNQRKRGFAPIAIDAMDTLLSVGKRTKSVPDEVRAAFKRELRRWVDANHDGNESAAARALGLTQGHVWAVLNDNRGPGLPLLLRMREVTGKSIDELLGVGPPPGEHLTERLRMSIDTDAARMKSEAKRDREEAANKLAEAERILRLAQEFAPRRNNRKG